MASSAADETQLFADETQIAAYRLFEAVFTGKIELLNKIAAELKSGTETLAETFLRVKDPNDLTVLHFAAEAGETEICKYLIETLKLDVNLEELKSGSRPLHHAATFGRYTTAEYLLDIGANPNLATRQEGYTALHFAVVKGHEDLVSLLIERGADLEAIDSEVGTALHVAAAYGNKDLLISLLELEANPNAFNDEVLSPLLQAIRGNSFDCMEPLIKAGADVNIEICGYTPLDYAATRLQPEAVKLLLRYEADPNATNWSGLTVLEKCASMGLHEECKILYPVTKKISYIKDWTIEGITKYMKSNKLVRQMFGKRRKFIVNSKSKGEASFKNKDYLDAISWYSKALNADPSDAVLLSNRSLCQAKLKNGRLALVDARSCIKFDPDWYKSHYRAGVAYALLKLYAKAADTFSDALKLTPDNKEIQDALREVVTLQVSS